MKFMTVYNTKKCDKHKISAKGIYVEALILHTCIAQKELLNSLLNWHKDDFLCFTYLV